MAGSSYFSNPSLLRIPHLMRDIHSGDLRVPRFQRPFIWQPDQRLALFESIYNGEPIGSILVWRTGEHELPCYTWHGPKVVFEGKKQAAPEYVLDGQQRLTTLYSSLALGWIASMQGKPDIYQQWQDGPGEQPEGGPVYFDLETESFELLTGRRKTVPATWLPLWMVFDAYELDEYRSRLPDTKDKRTWYAATQKLAARLTDYTIPIIPLITDDLQHAIRSFHRINSAGTPMAEEHFLSALTWSKEFDLMDRLDQIRESLDEVGWGDIDNDTILKTAKALHGLDLYQADQKVADKLQDDPNMLAQVEKALLGVAAFLADELAPYEERNPFLSSESLKWPAPIHGPKALPYKLQTVLLAHALWLLQDNIEATAIEDQKQVRSNAHVHLKRWLWATSLTEHFGGISSSRLRHTQEHVNGIALGHTTRVFPETDTASDTTTIKWKPRFDYRSARSRVLCLLMARFKPMSIDGAVLPASELLTRYGNHATMRLFTRAQLRNDKQLADSPGNRLIVEPTQARLLRKCVLEKSDKLPDGFWESHGFNESARHALDTGGWHQAIQERIQHLAQVEWNLSIRLGIDYSTPTRPISTDEIIEREAQQRAEERMQSARLLGSNPNIEQLVNWFFDHYEDPANSAFWDGEEGRYICMKGGPYSASDVLWDYFDDANEDHLQEAIDKIEEHGHEWEER